MLHTTTSIPYFHYYSGRGVIWGVANSIHYQRNKKGNISVHLANRMRRIEDIERLLSQKNPPGGFEPIAVKWEKLKKKTVWKRSAIEGVTWHLLRLNSWHFLPFPTAWLLVPLCRMKQRMSAPNPNHSSLPRWTVDKINWKLPRLPQRYISAFLFKCLEGL